MSQPSEVRAANRADRLRGESAEEKAGRQSAGERARVALAVLGVVYGDLGTSAIYALHAVFTNGYEPLAPNAVNVLGVVSLVFWTLIVVVSLKYMSFVLRADNRGEGGTFALIALLRPWRHVEQRGRHALVLLGLAGASMLYAGISGFVFITSLVALQQSEAREEQRRLNAELRATRALLTESARVNERTRISRELHDLLGHHLTALSLNLEVAGHLSEGRVKEHVQQAHTLARLLLTDVREAVSQLRESGAIDLGAALRPLAENVPKLEIHMDIQQPLTVEDPERAHVLLRCAQEGITNVVRHAGARNLWLSAHNDGGQVVMQVRDDGAGTESLVPGNGLQGLRERLRQCGGRLEIATGRSEGFRLTMTLPTASSADPRTPEGVVA